MKVLFTTLFIFLTLHLLAQTGARSVVVYKDARIDSLIRKQIEINEITTRDLRSHVPGFRILVASTNNREKATEAKTKLYQNFPDLKIYFIYQAPYFKVKVGNFAEREDAENALPAIQKVFSDPVYIVHDIIELSFGPPPAVTPTDQ